MRLTTLLVAVLLGILLWIVVGLLAALVVSAKDCEAEPASQWAPAGWICPPAYGEGIASTWQGPGSARNDCVWPFDQCIALTVISLDTGRSIVSVPTTWCMCWVGVIGPLGETERIIDLAPDQVAALGLPGPGLYRVRVEPATVTLPNTALDR